MSEIISFPQALAQATSPEGSYQLVTNVADKDLACTQLLMCMLHELSHKSIYVFRLHSTGEDVFIEWVMKRPEEWVDLIDSLSTNQTLMDLGKMLRNLWQGGDEQ